ASAAQGHSLLPHQGFFLPPCCSAALPPRAGPAGVLLDERCGLAPSVFGVVRPGLRRVVDQDVCPVAGSTTGPLPGNRPRAERSFAASLPTGGPKPRSCVHAVADWPRARTAKETVWATEEADGLCKSALGSRASHGTCPFPARVSVAFIRGSAPR